MPRIILQPSDEEHYRNTIESRVSLLGIKRFLSDGEFTFLAQQYPDGNAPIWGVTIGKRGVNRTRWRRIESGDIALFGVAGRIFSCGRVTLKIHSRDLSEELWPRRVESEPWELVYFLKDIRPLNVPYSIFNEFAGYAPDNIIRGFNVLNEIRSERVSKGLGLYETEISADSYLATLGDLDSLDERREALVRKEQGFLRDRLFGEHEIDRCGICGQLFPVGLLVAAHIKKRAECSDSERRDPVNLMPMCKFGCDELFERGYIKVLNGTIVVSSQKSLTAPVRGYIKNLTGRHCDYWNSASAPYFRWHSEHSD